MKKDPEAKIILLSLFWKNMDKGIKTWLTKIADPLKFINNILCIIHPILYNTAYEVMNKLKVDPITGKYVFFWPTIYSGLSPITNRTSRKHRNHFGAYFWYNQVVIFRSYKLAIFHLPKLEATFQYNSGTVVQFCGNLLLYSING